jgi:hypothetical protein
VLTYPPVDPATPSGGVNLPAGPPNDQVLTYPPGDSRTPRGADTFPAARLHGYKERCVNLPAGLNARIQPPVSQLTRRATARILPPVSQLARRASPRMQAAVRQLTRRVNSRTQPRPPNTRRVTPRVRSRPALSELPRRVTLRIRSWRASSAGRCSPKM